MLLTSIGWANSFYRDEYTKTSMLYVDDRGITWRSITRHTPIGHGHHTEMVGHPPAGDIAFDSYGPPDVSRPELNAEAERAIGEFKNEQ
jgi:hypothetical protein